MSDTKLLRAAYEYCDSAQKLLKDAEQLVKAANNTENLFHKNMLLSKAKQNHLDAVKLMSTAYSLQAKYSGTVYVEKARKRKQFAKNYNLNIIQNND